MLSHPDITPNVTAVSFEVHTDNGAPPEHIQFLYDPEEAVHPTALNNPDMDCNQQLTELAARPEVKMISVSVSIDNSTRTILPINPRLIQPASVGEVFKLGAEAMALLPPAPDRDHFLAMAALVGHTPSQEPDTSAPSPT